MGAVAYSGGAMTATIIAILSGAVGAILAALGAYLKGRRDGATRGAQRAAEAKQKQEAKGRDAVAKERDETDGMSAADLAERVRKRSDRWRM